MAASLSISRGKSASVYPVNSGRWWRGFQGNGRGNVASNPFAFMTNGLDTYFLEVGFAAKRLVAGFFTSDDLERLLFIRQNGKALGSIQISNTITDRAYQHEAIRRLSEAFEQGKRKALIVMATGSGKTRTAMSLIEFTNRLVV